MNIFILMPSRSSGTVYYYTSSLNLLTILQDLFQKSAALKLFLLYDNVIKLYVFWFKETLSIISYTILGLQIFI